MCSVCGGTAEPLALLDGRGELPQFATEGGKPELEWALEAWSRGEHARVVSHCLSAEGAQGVKNRTLPEGPAYVALLSGISVTIRVDSGAGTMTIETPVARLPQTQYVGAMRLALELSAGTRSAARYAARAETLYLRMVGRLEAMSPAILQSALRSIVSQAIDDAKVLSTSVRARVVSPREHIDFELDTASDGHQLDLGSVRPPSLERPTVPAEADMSMPNLPPLSSARVPSLRAPTGTSGAGMGAGPRADTVKVEAQGRVSTSRSAHEKPTPYKPIAAVSRQPAGTPVARIATGPGQQRVPTGQQRVPTGQQRVPTGQERIPTAQRNPMDTPATNLASGLDAPSTPEDALCELLHKAQTLGALLSFADQPATTALLIRATVFRVVLGFDQALPSATSRLYADAAALTKEIYITAPGIRRGAMAIPSATEAFDSMRKIVDSRCAVENGPAVQVTPITSSQDAKQHLARYVSEIDQAPKDLEVRHFLALGALSELLVRAKLPAQTLERLRGIIAHAEKDGAKQAVVDLMMTALNRMMA